MEPPVIFVEPVKITDFSSKIPIDIFVDALAGLRNVSLQARIQNIPESVDITPGTRTKDTVVLNETQMKSLIMQFKGPTRDFKLIITVEAFEHNRVSQLRQLREENTVAKSSRSFEFLVSTAGSLKPDLKLSTKDCYFTKEMKVEYTVSLPFGESDLISLTVSDVPDHLSILNGEQIDNTTYYIQNATSFTDFSINGTKNEENTINITITVSAKPKYGEKIQKISVKKCKYDSS